MWLISAIRLCVCVCQVNSSGSGDNLALLGPCSVDEVDSHISTLCSQCALGLTFWIRTEPWGRKLCGKLLIPQRWNTASYWSVSSQQLYTHRSSKVSHTHHQSSVTLHWAVVNVSLHRTAHIHENTNNTNIRLVFCQASQQSWVKCNLVTTLGCFNICSIASLYGYHLAMLLTWHYQRNHGNQKWIQDRYAH